MITYLGWDFTFCVCRFEFWLENILRLSAYKPFYDGSVHIYREFVHPSTKGHRPDLSFAVVNMLAMKLQTCTPASRFFD